jgi:hypothetical protein
VSADTPRQPCSLVARMLRDNSQWDLVEEQSFEEAHLHYCNDVCCGELVFASQKRGVYSRDSGAVEAERWRDSTARLRRHTRNINEKQSNEELSPTT